MEGLYVDIRSLLDETTQERYHERIGGEYMGKSGVINQDFKGEDNTASESYLYVCDGYPDDCDAYVGAHKKSLLPKGELADGQLRNKRILAHRALITLLKEGGMTRKSAYIWLQNKLCLQKKDMHIAKFSLYYCEETIRVCNELIEWHQKRKGE